MGRLQGKTQMNTKNVFLYWRMANGHEHSYLEIGTEDIMQEYATENEKGTLTQEQYIEYIENKEHTTLEDIQIIEFKDINETFAQSLLDNDLIADFEIENEEVLIEFY